jgi:hypothetical protein
VSSKRHMRRKGCEGKIRYSTPEAAEQALRETEYVYGTRHLNVYACNLGGGPTHYHVGHRSVKYSRQTRDTLWSYAV